MNSTISTIVGVIVVAGTTLLFRFAQRKGLPLFGPRERSRVVPGMTEQCLQWCYEALDSTRRFSITEVDEKTGEIRAKYRAIPVWAELTVTFIPVEAESTEINVAVLVSPNLFTLLTSADRRIFSRFFRAFGVQATLPPHQGADVTLRA